MTNEREVIPLFEYHNPLTDEKNNVQIQMTSEHLGRPWCRIRYMTGKNKFCISFAWKADLVSLEDEN